MIEMTAIVYSMSFPNEAHPDHFAIGMEDESGVNYRIKISRRSALSLFAFLEASDNHKLFQSCGFDGTLRSAAEIPSSASRPPDATA